jgi:DNA polymerase
VFEALIEPTYDSWHSKARALVITGIHPSQVTWTDSTTAQPLLGELASAPPGHGKASTRLSVPRRFVEFATLAARHSSATRWGLLYRVLWRIVQGDRALIDNELDDDARQLRSLVRGVKEDVERMKAFVRFRSVGAQGEERFVAWHRPDYDVAALVAPHFARRYPNMRWSVFTPHATIHWDGYEVTAGPGVPESALPSEDSNRAAETLWRTYYAASFNPARVNESKLARDMPARFRAPLPEAEVIPPLLSGAHGRTEAMRSTSGGVTSRASVPATKNMDVLRAASRSCTGCDLFKQATQTVFGEGPSTASIVLVGEQPGDAEDTAGRPFVGPAGALLERALADAGIERSSVYVTNAVKHFAWEPRGKRRIHRTPRLAEMRACRPWVEAELASIAPEVIVCLGGTAAQTLLGPQARVHALRGKVITGQSWAPKIVVTLHPAAVLRADGAAAQENAYATLAADLKLARQQLPPCR